jgi:aldose sugar dehydrogenase
VSSEGQGGLMDVVLHPGFAQNRLVYFSYSEAGQGGKGVVLARGVFDDGAQPVLQKVETLFRAVALRGGRRPLRRPHRVLADGHLFFTNGDRQKFDPAQDPKATLGKVLRLTDDGTPAPGNPLVDKGFHPAVWSYGHRNPLGIAFDASGNLWAQEMGPKGGDEVNLILPGRNYGYPIVSDGDHYDGRPIPDHATRPEFEKPKVSWNPVISPGGLMVYSGKLWPEWKGDLFIGGLSSQALIRVDVDGTNARKGDQWPMGERIREPEEGPDGAIWLLEDGRRGGKGRLLKLTPLGSGATRQRDAFVRLVRVVAFLEGRPPRRPLAREARAFASLLFAPSRAAGPTTLIRAFPRSETRATRTRASGRVPGCSFRYSVRTARMARSAFECESAAA